MSEIIEARTLTTKTFDLGGGRKRLMATSGKPLHYLLNGSLEDINLEPTSDQISYLIDKAPYALRVATGGPAYRYTSARGEVQVTLQGVVASALKDGTNYRWNVGTDAQYVIQPLAFGCATKLILASAQAPRTWSWEVLGDVSMLKPIVGRDANFRECEIITTLNGDILTAEWTGRVTSKGLLRRNPSSPWSRKVAYPVTIDPTVNETIGAGADDVVSAYGTLGSTFVTNGTNIAAGFYTGGIVGPDYVPGLRFQTIAMLQGETINTATLTYNVAAAVGSPSIRWYADDVDDAAAWSAGSLPKNITKTTAFAADTSASVSSHAIDVTSIVQEIINRAGWASGNDMRFAAFDQTNAAPNIILFEALEAAGTAQATLDINYGTATNTQSHLEGGILVHGGILLGGLLR